MPENRTLICIVPSMEQPRVIKRIIEKAYFYEEVEVYGITRDLHKVENYGKFNDYPNIKVKHQGCLTTGSVGERLGEYCKLLLKIYFSWSLQKKDVYAFGLDMRILASLILNSTIYYEISDIIWLYRSGLQRYLMRNIDYLLARVSKQVIFTSAGFYESYYRFLSNEKVLIVENKFNSFGKVKPLKKIVDDKIRIAYVGAFRYKEIMRHLIKFCSINQEKYVLNFYGDGPKDIISEIISASSEFSNIKYWSAFKNPDDLELIYKSNNLNFVAYDNKLENERVAMPNKFYESGFFNMPIVCSENTYVGKRVEHYKMGWMISPTYAGISEFLLQLNIEDLLLKHNEIRTIDKRQFETK